MRSKNNSDDHVGVNSMYGQKFLAFHWLTYTQPLTHRFMLGLAGLPSLIMFFGFLFMPESPRWLVFRGKIEKARRVLGKVRQHHEVEEELKTIIRDREDHKKSQGSK